eukprot:UC4_evm3s153
MLHNAVHGKCFGFETEAISWEEPHQTLTSNDDARPGYSSMNRSEFQDDPEVLRSKVAQLARLIRRSKKTVYYCGAGLSTSSGIPDYPSLGHRVLAALAREGYCHRIIQQNHDGLPQKAGVPQELMNEIHGSLHSPDNPVVPMSGELRSDLFTDLLECEAKADLAVAIGTSLCGMNADRIVTSTAEKSPEKSLGSVIIGLQKTVLDDIATLRIYGHIDNVFDLLAKDLGLSVLPQRPPKVFFRPPVLKDGAEGHYFLKNIAFNEAGQKITTGQEGTNLDLRDECRVVVPSGPFAGAQGKVDGYDREGNPRLILRIALLKSNSTNDNTTKKKTLIPVPRLLGTWWLQAIRDSTLSKAVVLNRYILATISERVLGCPLALLTLVL